MLLRLSYLSYKVHDTFDAFEGYGDNRETVVFEPGGTGLDVERNVYAFNTFWLCWIYKRPDFLSRMNWLLNIQKIFFGGTALESTSRSATEDVFTAEDF